jgi:hypothetical protein
MAEFHEVGSQNFFPAHPGLAKRAGSCYGRIGGHLFYLQCGRLVVDGPMGMARRWRVGRRGRRGHARLHNVNQPLAARCRLAAEGRIGFTTALQVGPSSRRPHVPEFARICCLAGAVYSAAVTDRFTVLRSSRFPYHRRRQARFKGHGSAHTARHDLRAQVQ